MTHAFEVIVPRKTDHEGNVVRDGKLIAQKFDCLDRPTREGLLMKYNSELKQAGIDETSIGEVETNIRPFLG